MVAATAESESAVKQTIQVKDYRPPSTWHRKSWGTKTFAERLVSLGLVADEYHDLRIDADRGPIPKHSTLREHFWILTRAGVAPALQQLSYWAFPSKSQLGTRTAEWR